ncbi:MAG: type II toxin-antitoxin system HicA family toxin [Anaerolineae bacterium]
MSQRKKLLEKLRHNPKNVRFEELETLLVQHGFQLVRVTGSHHYFAGYDRVISVVFRKPHVHRDAVQEVVKLLDDLFGEQ